jgi:L-histidine Nalpha-methyltransferase
MTPSHAAPAATPEADPAFLADVVHGLSLPQKTLPCKYFYDAAGSRLFDRICALEAYYPTRTETAILRENARRLAPVTPDGATLLELGSGSSVKTRILLDALPQLGAYAPVDISAEHLRAAAGRIAADYRRLAVHPVVADFTAAFAPPEALRRTPVLLFFPGSTIGNFAPDEAAALLARLRRLAGVRLFVVGVDLRKETSRLLAAYDDAEGVTAAFNLNLLARLNRELAADFDLDAFAHEARWNEEAGRVEMHLVSRGRQTVRIAGRAFDFAPGESIHTENSHKYTRQGFAALAAGSGWRDRETWVDGAGLFSVHVLEPDG